LDYGFHYWRPHELGDCSLLPWHTISFDNHDVPKITQESLHDPYTFVDADWTGGINTKNPVTGLDMILKGYNGIQKQISANNIT